VNVFTRTQAIVKHPSNILTIAKKLTRYLTLSHTNDGD